jgi:hypothetical protein
MRETTVTSHKPNLSAATLLAALAIASVDARAQQSDEELAKAALNPIAAMISLPLQYNYDQNIGSQESGHKNYLNVQPVIPFSLNEDWNLISRTIVPVIWQTNIFPGAGSQSGVGDITQSLFFSPKKPTADGWIWGAGPVFYLPTASNDLLGAEKWGLGPTAVVLKQEHGWTYGALVNHIWSVGGTSSRANINSTFLQPFLQYTLPSLTTFGINTESTYNWEAKNWSVPINVTVTQLLKIGEQRLTLQGGARYWADSPDSGAHGWGARFAVTFLFPK